MYSKNDWTDTLNLSPHEFREFLQNNTIEDIGLIDDMDWEYFYTKLTDENPFKEHRGTWPDIFTNWYRKHNDKTHALGIIASSMTNANEDFEFFNNVALSKNLWRIEDYYVSLKRKVLAIYKSNSSKETPSKRYFRIATQNSNKWKDAITNLVDDEYIVAICSGRDLYQNDITWISNIIKCRYKDLKPSTINVILKKFEIKAVFDELTKQGWPDKTVCKKILIRATKGTAKELEGCIYADKDVRTVIESIDAFSNTDKNSIKNHLMRNHEWDKWSPTAKTLVYNYFLTDEMLINSDIKIKEKILVDTIQEYTKLEAVYGKVETEICARIFRLYNFSPIIFDITDNLNTRHIKEVVSQHFKQIDNSVSIEDIEFFS